jgi:phosphatidylserine decarboxylase
MLVGSIGWSVKPGDRVRKAQELGWFQYGGSTIILVMPGDLGIRFDPDLVKNSEATMETVVRVGNRMAEVKQ